jgi:hypothetical protein
VRSLVLIVVLVAAALIWAGVATATTPPLYKTAPT